MNTSEVKVHDFILHRSETESFMQSFTASHDFSKDTQPKGAVSMTIKTSLNPSSLTEKLIQFENGKFRCDEMKLECNSLTEMCSKILSVVKAPEVKAGTGPTLFADSEGAAAAAVVNKNDRTNTPGDANP